MQIKMNNRLFQNQQLTPFQRNNPLSKATIVGKNSKIKVNNGGGFNISLKSNSTKEIANSKPSNISKIYLTLKHEEECLGKTSKIVDDTETMIFDEFEEPKEIESFEELTYGMDSKLSKKDLENLKTEYDKIITYEKNMDFKLVDVAINKFDSIIESKFTDRELDNLDFQRFKKDITGVFNEKDIQDLEKFRNQAISFEEKGDFKSADDIWSKFDSIVEKYDAEHEPMDMVEESDGQVELFNDEKSPLNIKISRNLNKLKKQMELLKILSNNKGKDTSKKNNSFQFDNKINYLKRIEKNGLKTVKPKELIRFLEKTQKVIDDAMEKVNVQKKNMESTFINSKHSFSEKNSIIDLYA